LRLAQATQHTIAGLLAFARLVRANLMHRRRLDRLLGPDRRSTTTPLNWRSSGAEAQPDSRGRDPAMTTSGIEKIVGRSLRSLSERSRYIG
jgi:hypothetical protein